MGGEDLNITLYFWLHGASPPFKRVWGPPAERRGPGAGGYCVPCGWSGLLRGLGAQRPGGPACPAGSPFLPRNGEKEGRGQAPWTPGFYSRSFPLAGFWDRCIWYDGRALTTDILKPIWDAFFGGKYAEKHFCERKFPNQGTYMGTVIAPLPEQCATTAKTSECQRAGHKKGGAGGHPPRLFASGLSLEKAWIPARDRAGTHLAGANLRRSNTGPPADGREAHPAPPGRRGPRGAAPQGCFGATHPKGTHWGPRPHLG